MILDAAVLLQVSHETSDLESNNHSFFHRLDGIKRFMRFGEHSLTKMKLSKGLLNVMAKVQRKLKPD